MSKNSDGTSAYTNATTIAGTAVRQIVAATLSVVNTTSSSQQRIYGLKLAGWTSNTELKKINVTISETSGSITTSDFMAGSTVSSNSGIGLFDSNLNSLTLDYSPTLAV